MAIIAVGQEKKMHSKGKRIFWRHLFCQPGQSLGRDFLQKQTARGNDDNVKCQTEFLGGDAPWVSSLPQQAPGRRTDSR